jgi:putative phosphoesterase
VRIAVLSDIHGNLPALEAVIKDLENQTPDEVWCGGDLAWGGPWGAECIAAVREHEWATVRGNTDVWITGDPQTVESPDEREQLQEVAEAHAIEKDDAQWLINLPLGHSGAGSVLLVHGTPESPFSAPEPDAPAAEFHVYEGHGALVIYGHVHRAFIRRLGEGTVVANTGAVGLPKDGTTASYLIIERQGSDLMLAHRRVAFDIDQAISRAREKDGPIAQRFVESMQSLS